MQLALRRSYGYAFAPPLNRGIGGLGFCDPSDPMCVSASDVIIGGDPLPSDPLLTDESGNNCLASMFVNGQCPQSADPSVLFGMGPVPATTPLPPVTPAEQAAQQAAAQAWLLQNIPATPSGVTAAQQLATLALTAAQIASGIRAGTVQTTPTSACQSGYKYSAGPCVPGSAPSILPGLSNTTLAIVAVGFVALVMMSGGKRR